MVFFNLLTNFDTNNLMLESWQDLAPRALNRAAHWKSDGATELQHEQLKEEVRKMIVGGSDEAAQQLKLIDAIQRLGVSYHFESEIDMALRNHVVNSNVSFGKCDKINDKDDLYMVALRFRLLRQQGHHVSCGK
ncbi:hypothetical protein LguiB_026720 [Lonicera macranthoides]